MIWLEHDYVLYPIRSIQDKVGSISLIVFIMDTIVHSLLSLALQTLWTKGVVTYRSFSSVVALWGVSLCHQNYLRLALGLIHTHLERFWTRVSTLIQAQSPHCLHSMELLCVALVLRQWLKMVITSAIEFKSISYNMS
jgi:hypothetical protein